jgi:hypothetical protein
MSLLVGSNTLSVIRYPKLSARGVGSGILVSSLRRPPIPFADYSPLQANERSPLPSPLGSSLCWWPPAALHGSESRQLTAAMGLGRVKTRWRKDARSTARRVHGNALEKSSFAVSRLDRRPDTRRCAAAGRSVPWNARDGAPPIPRLQQPAA